MCPATENADLAAGNCIASNGTFVDYGPTWTCSVAAGDSRLLTIQGDCAADNGSFTDDGPDPAQPALEHFTCLAPA